MRTSPSRALFALFVLVLGASVHGFGQTLSPLDAYQQGRSAQLGGDFFTAIEDYKTALEANPSYLDPLVGLAETYFALGEYAEALRFVQQAETFDSSNLNLVNLEGRTRVGLGQFDAARALFDSVLRKQPNNVDAQFGLAEIDVARGELRAGISKFQDGLRISPENRRALLSLIVVYDSLGEYAKAEQYVRIVLDAYPADAQVHSIAARHYLQTGNYAQAQRQVQTALTLKPGDVEATLALSEVLLRTGQYAKVVPLIEGILAKNRNDYLLWYSLGLAQGSLNDVTDAVQSFARAFTIHPDDEVSRIALESEIIDNLPLKDPLRAQYAQYHFDQGQMYESRDFLDRALIEYRRGLKIDPYNKDGRLLYAGVFKLQGNAAKYLSELNVLASLNLADSDVQDEIDVTTSALADSIASTWGVRQFTLQRESYNLSLFYSPNGRMVHYLGQRFLAEYVSDVLTTYENIAVPSSPAPAASFADAFRTARQAGTDYFLILNPVETDRYFQLNADLYVSATGSKIKSFSVYRTGNHRVTDALASVADSVHSVLPLEGRLIGRQFDQGLIDLGADDGVKANDSLLIVKNGSLALAQDRLGFSYTKDAVIGNFVVTGTDALVSQGNVVKNQFFDLINIGDYVIYPPPKNEQPTVEASPPSDLYQSILKIPSN